MAGDEQPSVWNDVVVGRLSVRRDAIELEPAVPALRTMLEEELSYFFAIAPRKGQPDPQGYVPGNGSAEDRRDAHKLLAAVKEHERDTASFDIAWPRKNPGKRKIVMRKGKRAYFDTDPEEAWQSLLVEFRKLDGLDVSLKMIAEAGLKAFENITPPDKFREFRFNYYH